MNSSVDEEFGDPARFRVLDAGREMTAHQMKKKCWQAKRRF
jgi:hypothetical protein